jgi:hypothetical protein
MMPDISERILPANYDNPIDTNYAHECAAYERGYRDATTALAEKDAEIERLREALQWIANVEPIKGLYHGGETYYGLNQRIKEHARQQLQTALGEANPTGETK